MNRMTKFSLQLSNWITLLLVVTGVYGFISLCAWNLNIAHWGGFARFVFACVFLMAFIWVMVENSDINARYYRQKENEEKESDKKVKL